MYGVNYAGILAGQAANPCVTYTLKCLVSKVIDYLEIGIVLIIGLAVVVFTWNVYRYFFKADLENKKEAGMYVMYSVIGFFVILSFWGFVAILSNTLKLPESHPGWPFGNQGSQNNRGGSIVAPPPVTGA